MTIETFLKKCEEIEKSIEERDSRGYYLEIVNTYPTLLKMLRVAYKAIEYIEWSGGKGVQEETAQNALDSLNELAKEVSE